MHLPGDQRAVLSPATSAENSLGESSAEYMSEPFLAEWSLKSVAIPPDNVGWAITAHNGEVVARCEQFIAYTQDTAEKYR